MQTVVVKMTPSQRESPRFKQKNIRTQRKIENASCQGEDDSLSKRKSENVEDAWKEKTSS